MSELQNEPDYGPDYGYIYHFSTDPHGPNGPNISNSTSDEEPDMLGYTVLACFLMWCFGMTIHSCRGIYKLCYRDYKVNKILRTKTIKTEHMKTLLNICSICLEPFILQDKVIILKCKHGYHEDCIKHWFENGNRTCPMCRENIFQ